MSQINIEQIVDCLKNKFVPSKLSFGLTATDTNAAFGYLELNSITWLLRAYQNKSAKSWNDLLPSDFTFYQVGKKIRQELGCEAISRQQAENYFKGQLAQLDNGTNFNANRTAANIGQNNVLTKGADATKENIDTETAKALPTANKWEAANINNILANLDLVMDLLNGNYGAKAEGLDDFQDNLDNKMESIYDNLCNKLASAYYALSIKSAKSLRNGKQIAELLEKCEAALTSLDADLDAVKAKAAQYVQNADLFTTF